ncbi:MAG: NAD(P)-dependent oxidoreductase [Proteobacteria bacterium]|nr:NAD(P)-dependent oxidoreductase [Pseudomonadota bacterium]MBU1596740.1 NAD(P)-dependent oxidoreductase [Pseudomonadota bacterium]
MPDSLAATAAPQSAARFGRAVVFGACGFLGREVVRRLSASGALVLGVDTRPWPGALPAGYSHNAEGSDALAEAAAHLGAGQGALSPGPPNGIPKGQGHLAGVQGAEPPAGARGRAPAAFFHLAGLADAGACQRDPDLARRLNVDLVALALDALSNTPCAFVFPSTGIVYGDALDRPAREDDPLLPQAEYARGKIEAEGLVRAACAAGPLRGAIARLSNLYGPGGAENTVLGRILAQARAGGPLQVWDESPVRDFLHVSDAAEGLLRLGLAALELESPAGALTANLSTGVGTSVGGLIDLCAELFHTPRLPQEREPGPAARASTLVLDNGRLAALTGWRPQTDLRLGLKRSITGGDAA